MAGPDSMPDVAGKLRLCQLDSYLRSLRTTVLSCVEVPAAPAAAGAAAAVPLFAVLLGESPLYPEGGGQPSDAGVLRLVSDSGPTSSGQLEVPVECVVVDAQGALAHHTRTALAVGAEVEVVVDWQRRHDHMQQHTGQHVLSAVADILVGADTTSWELHPTQWEETDTVTVDLAIAAITQEQVVAIERRCNDEVRASRAVRTLVVDPSDAAGLAAITASSEFRGALPPAGKTAGGALRLIAIESLDTNACGGTHVRNTAELQLIQVVGVERAKGCVRLKFLVGQRAISALGRSLTREARLTTKLMCAPARHEQAVDVLQKDRGAGAKVRKALAEEVAALLGGQLVAQLPAEGGGVAALHRAGGDLDFLTWVANSVLELRTAASLLLLTADSSDAAPAAAASAPASKQKGPKAPAPQAAAATAAAAAAPAASAAAGGGGDLIFLLAGQADLVKAVGPAVATLLAGKGGGRPGRYQGKAGSLERLPEALQVCRDAAAAASAAAPVK